MFNFFKKNKGEKSPQPTIPKNNDSDIMMSGGLEKKYNELLQKHKSNISELKQNAQSLIDQDDYEDKNTWLDALAICDIALENRDIDDTIKELYRQIYSRSRNKYVSCNLNESDYTFWFNKNVDINNRFIQARHYRGWCEQADLYSTARRPHCDLEKMKECFLEGVKAEDPASLGEYGYGLYMEFPGYTDKANKEEGLKLVLRSKELGYDAADYLLLYIDFYTIEDNNIILEKINEYIEKETLAYRKPYHLLADFYLNIENNFEKALDAMKKGAELNQHYSMYLLGVNTLNGHIENPNKAEGIRLLETAYEHYVPYAARFLGVYYNYANDENSSVEKAIEWYEKANLYYQAEAAFDLACIYLYNEKHNDKEKGLKYLEQAIDEGSVRALSEKAYLMLETDILPKDIDKAKTLLEKAMELGDEYAPYRLGIAYQNADFGGEPDYKKALELFELGAEREHLCSIELAGNYYRVGVGGDDEVAQKKAVNYLQRAVDRGSNYARVELAFCYEAGYGVEKDYQKAFDLYKEAAENNYPYANTKIAEYYEDGVLGEENVTEALAQYKIAAEAGMPEAMDKAPYNAMYNIGRYNKYAVGIPENPEEAMRWFHQAAEGGNAPALVELALAYEQEYGGTEFDATKAMEYMTKAAEMDYTYAQYKLGTYYYYGLLETDYDKAMKWFTKAYEAGYPWAALMLGDYYLYNVAGQEPQYEKAFAYYKFAEEQNVVSEGIGVCYEFGFGVEENQTEAFKYYTLAAKEGYTAAKYRLGLCYKYGSGTNENLTEAYKWFAEAAEEGNFYARYETAMMLLNGEGVALDTEKAIPILTAIAEENHDGAQFELGNCYLSGKGVAEDETQAMYWYQRAAENGNEQAQKITGKRERRKR